jgi:hypothetical protein
MTDSTSKPWWQSQTVLASIAVVAASGAKLAGLDIDAGNLTGILMDGAALAGGILALLGRVKATLPISWK